MKGIVRRTGCTALFVLAGCAAEPPLIPPPLEVVQRPQPAGTFEAAPPARDLATRISPTPRPPDPGRVRSGKPDTPAAAPAEEKADITLSFDQVPLPTLIQTVYANILKRTVNVDPAVNARQDLVTLRTGAPQTPSQVAETTRLLLKSYGIAVMDIGGLIRVVPDTANLGYLPEIRRGRALPETPLALRPIFQLVELQAVKNTDVALWLRTMFGNKVDVRDDNTRNALMLAGTTDNVSAALEVIQVLDQPHMRGRHSVRVEPSFWSADELARRLTEILQAQGYSAGTGVAGNFPITLLPVSSANAVIVFAASQELLNHVLSWVRDLDKPTDRGAGRNLFSYEVRHIDAQALATTLEKLLSGPVAAARPPAPPGAAAGAAVPASPPGRVVVNSATNTLIFQGYNEDYSQIRSLLQQLDRPAREALIEVTVAEVTLTDNLQLGVEWLLREARVDGSVITAGTLGGLSIGTSGFLLRRVDSAGDTRLLVNALASSNKATILSTPRVLARNGETATIQVGQEVPIITSQQVATPGGTVPSQTTLTVPQTVQYRNTGVILNVRPVIHSGDQVDLDISQEVSAAQATTTGVSSSPTFSTRKIQTKLSLKNGSTVLLGGLISSNRSDGNAGIPLLKNIPLLGHLFRTDTGRSDRTELLILITPYIISGDDDARAVTEAFRKRLGDWAQPTAPLSLPSLENPRGSHALPPLQERPK